MPRYEKTVITIKHATNINYEKIPQKKDGDYHSDFYMPCIQETAICRHRHTVTLTDISHAESKEHIWKRTVSQQLYIGHAQAKHPLAGQFEDKNPFRDPDTPVNVT